MNPELCVFDMAGTTVHDGDAVHLYLTEALKSAGLSVTRDEVNAVMGIPKPEAIRIVLQSHRAEGEPVAAEEIDQIHERFLEAMIGYYRTSPDVREVDGATKIFHLLRNAGIKIALDTGFSRPIAETVLARLGWREDELIDAVVTSDDVAQGRPWPDMIYQAMALTDCQDAQRVAKIGDTPSDLQEGTSAGCGWVIGVTGGSHTADELRVYPHTHLIGSVADLPTVFELK